MAEIETITIFKVDTTEAVQSVGDLRENIKLLKDKLQDATIGSDEYKNTLKELKVNQAALKDAMYATTASLEEVAAAANGTSQSYNSLVKQMADMKAELRTIDVSTEEGKERFQALAKSINGVNDQLKEMDALQGNYQRNVGNYTSALNGLGGLLKSLPPTLGNLDRQAGKVGQTLELVGKQPVLGMIGLIAPILVKIVGELQKSEVVTKAIKKALDALKPIMDFLGGIVEWLAEGLANVIDWFGKLVTSSGDTFKKIIGGVTGVGNALLQYLLTPIRTVIAAFKGLGKIIGDVFSGNFSKIKEDAKEAFGGITDAVKKGVSFKANFKAGQEVGAQFIDGMTSKGNKKKAKEEGKKVGEEYAGGVVEGFDEMLGDDPLGFKAEQEANKRAKQMADARLKELDKNAKHQLEMNDILAKDAEEKAKRSYEIQKQFDEKKLELLRQYASEALERGDLSAYLDYQQQAADLELEIQTNTIKEKKRLDEEDKKSAEAAAKARLQTLNAVASSTSALLGNIADLYEQSGKESEKQQRKIKAIRIAGATIDMLNGVVTAIAQAQQLGPIAGPIMAAVNSAAVITAGMANIAKIKATQVSGSSTSTATPDTVTAPAVTPQVQQVRTVTSASEEERLNQMASEQRVYILASDIEASQDAIKTRVAEATF